MQTMSDSIADILFLCFFIALRMSTSEVRHLETTNIHMQSVSPLSVCPYCHRQTCSANTLHDFANSYILQFDTSCPTLMTPHHDIRINLSLFQPHQVVTCHMSIMPSYHVNYLTPSFISNISFIRSIAYLPGENTVKISFSRIISGDVFSALSEGPINNGNEEKTVN